MQGHIHNEREREKKETVQQKLIPSKDELSGSGTEAQVQVMSLSVPSVWVPVSQPSEDRAAVSEENSSVTHLSSPGSMKPSERASVLV